MSDHSRWTGNRRTFLTGTGVAATATLAGCVGDLSGEGDENEVRMVLNPAEGAVDMERQYAPLFDYLEEETGIEISSSEAESYTATVDAIRNDHAELADISPTGVIAAPDAMDILGIRVQFGAEQYFSLIVTEEDSEIEELEDLEGEIVSMGDGLSVSGAIFPLGMLADAGLDTGTAPDGDPVDFEMRNSDHDTAREELFGQEEVVAAGGGEFALVPWISEDEFPDEYFDLSGESGNVGTALDDLDQDESELRVVAKSDPIPRAPIVARADWDDPIKDDIEEALLEATEEDLIDEDEDDDHQLWFDEIQPGSIDDYDPIQEAMNNLGLEMADLEDEDDE